MPVYPGAPESVTEPFTATNDTRGVFTTRIQDSSRRTDHSLAALRRLVMALRQSGLPFRRPPATGPLCRYPDRTPTGKPSTAFRTHTPRKDRRLQRNPVR